MANDYSIFDKNNKKKFSTSPTILRITNNLNVPIA